MKTLSQIHQKEVIRVIGLMSGTSCDGLDIALVEIAGKGFESDIHVLATHHSAYSETQRNYLLGILESADTGLHQISQVNFYLATIWSKRIRQFLKRLQVDIETIDLIGSHGQTLYHHPQKEKILKESVSSTLQCGDPAVLAQLCGITTVGDFRVGDMAHGGQGAPLVPYLDYILFVSAQKNTIALNIGGIANITLIPASGKIEEVIAFDTGPGNMIIDQLMQRFYERSYDRNGGIAKLGTLSGRLFEYLKKTDGFPAQKPPKSTGRECYGYQFVIELIRKGLRWRITEPDVIHTLTYYTAYTIYKAVCDFIPVRVDQLIVSGGGSHNTFLIERLRDLFGDIPVYHSSDIGVDADFKEAICFAVLANEVFAGHSTSIPTVTGARKPALLGKICPV